MRASPNIRWVPIAALVVAVLVAGCTGPGGGGVAEQRGAEAASGSVAPTGPAPPPTPNESFGAITGQVIDDEALPIRGATVSLIDDLQQAYSDDEGRFTFNGLQARTYAIVAERTGFAHSGRKVEVRLAETTEVTITLQPIVVPDQMYYRSLTRTAQIHAGHSMVTWPVQDIAYVNQTNVNALLCDRCQFALEFERGPKQILSEAVWSPGTGGTNADVWLAHYKNRTTASTNYVADYAFYLKSRGAQNWTSDKVSLWRNWGLMHVHVHGGLTTVNVEHKVELWLTYAYNGYLADGYSALPPT